MLLVWSVKLLDIWSINTKANMLEVTKTTANKIENQKKSNAAANTCLLALESGGHG
jgi:hypothetical protein